MNKQRIGIAISVIVLLTMLHIAPAKAQGQGGGWSEPYRLSSLEGVSSEGFMVADQYGYVHCFWIETYYENGETAIKYARFDGTIWTKPNDIYVVGTSILNVSPVVDQHGTLHIIWSEGEIGTVYYAYAPATGAVSVQNWSRPVLVDVPGRPAYLQVDSHGVFHIMYTNQTEESGVYYIRSEDQGRTWTTPLWLDPDIRLGSIPDSLSFALDDQGGLHAAWFYGSRAVNGVADWVRYTHSLDGGHTWSAPFTIDKAIVEVEYNLTNASPVMTVEGDAVHIIWAAGDLPYRHHRFSTDRGTTWSTAGQVFGELHGQAFDTLTVDGAGRVHFFGQIRYPMGIYHAFWKHNRWTIPSLLYLVAQEGEEIGTRVHAHDVRAVVRAGNQLVVTFADGPADPNRRLFVTYRTLEDIPPIESMPTPSPVATAIQSPTAAATTPLPEQTRAASLSEPSELQGTTSPDLAIRLALIPTLLVLGVTMYFQIFRRRRR